MFCCLKGYDDWDNTVADGTRAPGVYLGDEINGQWVMLTIVVDRAAGTMYGYKNGTRVQDTDSVTNLGSVSNDKPLTFGAQRNTPSDFFKGKLDDVRIYNRALSAAEVAQNSLVISKPTLYRYQQAIAGTFLVNMGNILILNLYYLGRIMQIMGLAGNSR